MPIFVPLQNGMMIVVEEKLNYVIYANGLRGMPKIKDRLAIELKLNNSPLDYPVWDFEFEKEEASAKIYVYGDSKNFLVEGVENLYYVFGDQISYISKETLFTVAVDNTLADSIIEDAGINGYDTSDPSSKNLVAKATALVLKHVDNIDERPIRVPYPLEISLKTTPPQGDYTRIPMFYSIDKDGCIKIVEVMSKAIKTQFHLGQEGRPIPPIYSHNWFISKIVLQ